ncbi:hypothetical protein IMG5_020770, partial [Ichthyophthirius multifiliis]
MKNILSYCNNCRQLPEDILMLQCRHDLCLNCASLIFTSENINPDSKIITCLTCGKCTQLEKQTVYQLQKINIDNQIQTKILQSADQQKIFIIQNIIQIQNNQKISNLNLLKNKKILQLKKNSQLRKITIYLQNHLYLLYISKLCSSYLFLNKKYKIQNKRIKKYKCQDHPEEDISYYCFQCLSKSICPECIIHGSHQ